jgi:hypothetical protein
VDAVSVCPTCAAPEIVGAEVFVGAPGDETTPVGTDTAAVLPSAFRALTDTRIVEPESASEKR